MFLMALRQTRDVITSCSAWARRHDSAVGQLEGKIWKLGARKQLTSAGVIPSHLHGVMIGNVSSVNCMAGLMAQQSGQLSGTALTAIAAPHREAGSKAKEVKQQSAGASHSRFQVGGAVVGADPPEQNLGKHKEGRRQ
jgi:hypothetical protein